MNRRPKTNSGTGLTVKFHEVARVADKQPKPKKRAEANMQDVQEIFAAEKQFALFLTPHELFVWNALLANLKLNEQGEVRIPIPKTEEGKITKWMPTNGLFTTGELDLIIDHFIAVKIIEFVGSSGNGHDTYRMIRHPGTFHVIPITERKREKITPDWMNAIRRVQAMPPAMLRKANCRKAIANWVHLQIPDIPASTANVKLFNFRPDGYGGWGIPLSNPDVNTNSSIERRLNDNKVNFYLIVYPGFEAYIFIDNDDACSELVVLPLSLSDATMADSPQKDQPVFSVMPEEQHVAENAGNDDKEPAKEATVISTVPVKTDDSPTPAKIKTVPDFSELDDKQLAAYRQNQFNDINQLTVMLKEAQACAVAATQKLHLRLERQRKAMILAQAELARQLEELSELEASLKHY